MSGDTLNDDFQKVTGSEVIGGAQVLTHEKDGRERAGSDIFNRQRTDTFKHGFCDYDMSQMRSE